MPTVRTKTTATIETVRTESTTGDPDAILRKRISIPVVDADTLAWWEAQQNVSFSLRVMILEEVGAHGYADRIARIARPAASAAMPQPAAMPVPPQAATPAPSATGDPRDEEIARLNAELEDLKAKCGPFLPFLMGDNT
jgi:hypothetical protein